MIDLRPRSSHSWSGGQLPRVTMWVAMIAVMQTCTPSWCQDPRSLDQIERDRLEQLASQLQGEELQFRREAAIATLSLDRSLQRELLPLLIERLDREKDGQVRLAVLATITDMGPDAAEAVTVLAESMRVDHGGRTNEETHQDYRVALALASIGAPAVDALRQLLREPAANDRAEAAMALGRIGPPASLACPDLIQLLSDDEPRVRDEATLALGLLGESALESLLPEVGNADPKVVAGAIEALGNIPGDQPERRKAIQAALDHDDTGVRTAAIRAIESVALPADQWQGLLLEHLQSRSKEVRLAAIHAILTHPDRLAAMTQPLSEMLHHADDGVAQHAAFLLYRIGPEAMPSFFAALERDTSRVESIGQAMAMIGPSAQESLVEAISHPHPRVRQAAALALGGIRPASQDTIQRLSSGLSDPDVETRRAFLKAIGSLEVMGRPAAAVVKDLLGDSDPGLREEAIAVLFRIALRDQELVQRLMPLINDGETSVQLRAIDTLQAVGPIGRQALPAVIEQLGNPSITVRQSSAAFVSSHGGSASAAVAPLTTMLEDDDAAWRLTVIATLGKLGSAAQASFSKLSDLIDDPDAKIRAASVDAVGNLGLDAAELLPYLERALASSDSDVQSGALQIVRRLGNDQAIALIASIVPLAADEEHQRSVLRAAERLEPLTTPPQAVKRLRELLSHEHVEVQRLAIRFLGQAGDAAEDSLEQIRAYLQASDESIQKEAAAAVAKIEGASP